MTAVIAGDDDAAKYFDGLSKKKKSERKAMGRHETRWNGKSGACRAWPPK
jgi:hypothetical protein